MTSRVHPGSLRTCRAAALVVLSLAGWLSVAATANAQETLAASCDGPRAEYSGANTDRLAQTFVPSLSGSLTRAEIHRFIEPPGKTGDYVVQILAVDSTGRPTDTVLAQTTVAEGPEGPDFTLNAVFASPASVVAGQTYVLALSRPGAGGFAWGYTIAGCPGSAFKQPNGTGPWTQAGASDQLFSVFVTPEPEPAPKADGTLTIDANKGKVEKGRKVTLSGQLDVAANESCEQSRPIQIQRRKKSQPDSAFTTFETVPTDAAGNFTTREKVKKTYFYRAVVSETEACDDETSNSQKVRVQKKKAAQEA